MEPARRSPAPGSAHACVPTPAIVLRVIVQTQEGPEQGVNILLRFERSSGTLPCMTHSPAYPGVCTDATRSDLEEHVVGRIDAPPDQLKTTIAEWLDELDALGRSGETVRAYRTFVQSLVADRGWTKDSDITYAAATKWMGAKRKSGDWMGTTYNNNLSKIRSLTDYMRRTGRVQSDPLGDARRCEDDGGQGARASTTDQALAMVRHAWARQIADRRCRSNRALQRLCQFTCALRRGEPKLWRWKHMRLDDEIEHVAWTKDIQKNGRDEDVALTAEAAALLRRHREAMRGAKPHVAHDKKNKRKIVRPADSNDPEAFVFASVSPPHTWTTDRDELQIPATDHRGRSFSPHSARKWFETVLQGAGIPDRTCNALMRHEGDVGGKYLDMTLEAQAAALKHLPRLWPEPVPELSTRGQGEGGDLTTAGRPPHSVRAYPGSQAQPTDSALVPSTRQNPGKPRGNTSRQPCGGTRVERSAEDALPGLEQLARLSSPDYQSENGQSRT